MSEKYHFQKLNQVASKFVNMIKLYLKIGFLHLNSLIFTIYFETEY